MYPTNFLLNYKCILLYCCSMFNLCCIQIAAFSTISITMFILHYSNQLLHVTTPRVCYITISSTNVNMYVYHRIPQLVILIKSWSKHNEKFLSPALPPWSTIDIYKNASCYKLLNIYNILYSIMHLGSAY